MHANCLAVFGLKNVLTSSMYYMCAKHFYALFNVKFVIGQLQENDEALSMWIFDDVVAGDKLTK